MANMRLRIYRRIKAALIATNRRTDNSIITECNIVMPIVNDKGVTVVSDNKYKKKVRKVEYKKIER